MSAVRARPSAPHMGFLYKRILRPIFFSFDPEFIHDMMTNAGAFLGKIGFGKWLVKSLFSYSHPMLEQKLWGIPFKNPVGLGAGFDKDAKVYSIMGSVGFGFAEIGTITFGSYEGNPKPRLYRLPQSKALVVYYGLKNMGAKAMTKLLKTKDKDIPQIISIGRTNAATAASFEDSIVDYYKCFKEFVDADVGDAYEINISCPNLFGGVSFDDEMSLEKLLQKIYTLQIKKPVFIKMPINLPWPEFKKLVDVALRFKVQALVIGNLNKNRNDPTIKEVIPENIKGSISGKPTRELSNNLISETYKYCGDKIKIIGLGGIFSAADAYEKICRGASMVELITGMIYEGPGLIGNINRDLVTLLKKDGYQHISEAVGALNPL